MTLEIPDTTVDSAATVGWVFYDGHCPLCRNWVGRVAPWLARRGFQFAPLQTSWACRKLGLVPGHAPMEMMVLTHKGEALSGADAATHLAGQIWWAKPLAWLARLPGAKPLLRAGYRWIARRRNCDLRSGKARCGQANGIARPPRRHSAFLELP